MRNTKIAFCDLVTSFGGVQRVMLNLLPELNKSFEIVVIDPYSHREYRENLVNKGVSCYYDNAVVGKSYVGGKGSWKWYLMLFLALPRILKIRNSIKTALKQIKPDVVYTNQLSALQLIGILRLARRIHIVYHAHGFVKPDDISKKVVNFINSRVKQVIAVSNSTANIMKQAGVNPEKITICYNAVSIEEIERKALANPYSKLPKKEEGQTVFLLPAVMQYNKGFHLAIKALAILTKNGNDAVLWFAGDIPQGGELIYKKKLKKLAERMNIADRVHFLGWRKDIYSVVNNSDVILLCSESESFGMVLVEAMTLGKPCIGANVGGIPEVIEDRKSGLLFERGSPESLAVEMGELICSVDAREMYATAGRHRVKTLFSIPTQQNRIKSIITSSFRH